jgi:hypothetical protein
MQKKHDSSGLRHFIPPQRGKIPPCAVTNGAPGLVARDFLGGVLQMTKNEKRRRISNIPAAFAG